jgi:TRAP-type C4-dicarboxylate transport system substrate-binding protein
MHSPRFASGAVDGQENPLFRVHAAKLHTVGQKHVTMWGYVADPLIFVVNKDIWNSGHRPTRRSCAGGDRRGQGGDRHRPQRPGRGRQALLKDIAAMGVTVTALSPAEREAFVKATRPVYDKWKPDRPRSGEDGRSRHRGAQEVRPRAVQPCRARCGSWIRSPNWGLRMRAAWR